MGRSLRKGCFQIVRIALAKNDVRADQKQGIFFVWPYLEIVTETSKFSKLSSNEISNEVPINTSCKYYKINEY